MTYICEKCFYMFLKDKAPDDLKDNRYRCPDCGKFAVRLATDAEREEYINRQSEKEEN